MSPLKLRLLDATLHRTQTKTRMPFRFGIAVMTEAPHVFLRCTFETGTQAVSGIAADGLLPKWFDKSPEKGPQQELEELLLVIRQAVTFARSIQPTTAFDFWRQLYAAQMSWAAQAGLPPLLAHFGVSMVERTMLDALARANHTTISTVLRENLLGVDLGALYPELQGRVPSEFLPRSPLSKVIARHTVGLSDPLTDAELQAPERLHDGLPQSLEACIRFYGLRHFKLKISGNTEIDLDRLQRTAAVITQFCGSNYAFTLDGNEQFKDFELFVQFWDHIEADPRLSAFFKNLIFIEQPLHRSVALDPKIARIKEWHAGPPMIIDESDAEVGNFPLALELGYTGTSHKNCKGVIKGLANRCLIQHRNLCTKTNRHQMSGEDLVNIGPVALLQDLAVQAALGNESVERNGHHYFSGLSPFPAEISKTILAHHSDLYTPFGEFARVDVRNGELEIESVNRACFGIGADLPLQRHEDILF